MSWNKYLTVILINIQVDFGYNVIVFFFPMCFGNYILDELWASLWKKLNLKMADANIFLIYWNYSSRVRTMEQGLDSPVSIKNQENIGILKFKLNLNFSVCVDRELPDHAVNDSTQT